MRVQSENELNSFLKNFSNIGLSNPTKWSFRVSPNNLRCVHAYVVHERSFTNALDMEKDGPSVLLTESVLGIRNTGS